MTTVRATSPRSRRRSEGARKRGPAAEPARAAQARTRTRAQAPKDAGAGEDVRASVLAGAAKLIEEQGLAGLSMREVARAAGVSHQAPYHYFQDRESILAALAEKGFNLLSERLAGAVDPAVRPAERLVALGRVYAEFACAEPALFRVMFRPDVVRVDRFPGVKDCGARAFDTLIAAVQACIEDGLPPVPSPMAIVVLSWSVAHGLACLLLDGPLQLKIPDVMENRDALVTDVVKAFAALFDASARQASLPAGVAQQGPGASAARPRSKPRRTRP